MLLFSRLSSLLPPTPDGLLLPSEPAAMAAAAPVAAPQPAPPPTPRLRAQGLEADTSSPPLAEKTPQRAPTAAAPGLSAEVRQRVRANRAAALARRKRKQAQAFAAPRTTCPCTTTGSTATPATSRARHSDASTAAAAQSTPVAQHPRRGGRRDARLSGCQGIDGLFRTDTDGANDGAGGFPCGEVIEVSGVASSGKTQLCYTLCAQSLCAVAPASSASASASPNSGAADPARTGVPVKRKAVWVHCQGTPFYAKRLLQIAQETLHPSKALTASGSGGAGSGGGGGGGVGEGSVCDRLLTAQAYHVHHLFHLLEKVLRPTLSSEPCTVGVIILDGILHMFKTELQGSSNELRTAMHRLMAAVQKLAKDFACPLVLTNQVIANVNAGQCDGPTSVFSENERFVRDLPCRLRLHRKRLGTAEPARTATRLSTGFQAAYDITAAGVVDQDASADAPAGSQSLSSPASQ